MKKRIALAVAVLAVVTVVGVSLSTAAVFKVQICHLPNSPDAEPIAIEVGDPAVDAHIDHGGRAAGSLVRAAAAPGEWTVITASSKCNQSAVEHASVTNQRVWCFDISFD